MVTLWLLYYICVFMISVRSQSEFFLITRLIETSFSSINIQITIVYIQ